MYPYEFFMRMEYSKYLYEYYYTRITLYTPYSVCESFENRFFIYHYIL